MIRTFKRIQSFPRYPKFLYAMIFPSYSYIQVLLKYNVFQNIYYYIKSTESLSSLFHYFQPVTIFVFIYGQTFSAFYDFQHSFFVTANFMWLDIFSSHCLYDSALAQFKFGSVTPSCPTLSNSMNLQHTRGFHCP